MNIKERLEGRSTGSLFEKTPVLKENYRFIPEDFFLNADKFDEYIVKPLSNNRNIIFICRKSFDNYVIAECIRSAQELNSIEHHFRASNIEAAPDIPAAAKISAQALQGSAPFIFGLNLADFSNVINKLKLLFALGCKNLSSLDIITLIGSVFPLIVYILKDKSGMFYISGADEIRLNETGTELELINIFNGSINQERMEEKDEKSKENIQLEEIKQDEKEPAKTLKSEPAEKNTKKETEIKRGRKRKKKLEDKKPLEADSAEKTLQKELKIKEKKPVIKEKPEQQTEPQQPENINKLENTKRKKAGRLKKAKEKAAGKKALNFSRRSEITDFYPVISAGYAPAKDEQAENYLKKEEKYTSESGKKVNKYQMLKEKAKKKKNTEGV